VPGECAPDRRVQRTRRQLQEAVLALAAERDFATITVEEIAARADVNRATFYRHYRDKDDLVAQALDALFDEFTADSRAFLEARGRLAPDVVPPPLVRLFQHVGARPELYRRLLGETGSRAFAVRLRAFHEREFLQIWRDMRLPERPGGPPPAVRARFAAAAAQGVIGWWIERGLQESSTTMAAWLWQLIRPVWFASPLTASEGAEIDAIGSHGEQQPSPSP
jgi:AcrR family transcriptional regulator